jgi:hypothetical protein
MGQHTRQAMEWVEKNAHRFREPVVGPVAMYMNIRDAAAAVMFEKMVPMNRLLCFLGTF